MKKITITLMTAAVWAMMALNSNAQTNLVTLTNMVTVTVTNVVTVTNTVASEPAPAAKPAIEEVPKYPWKSSVTAGLTLTRGNSHSLLFYGALDSDKKTPVNEYSLGASGAYGSQDSQDNVNNYGAYGQWNHLFSDRLYSYVRAEAKRDLIADLDYRFSIGPGAGYYWIKGTNTTLSTEAGAGFQDEHLGADYNSFATFRLAENFEHKFNDHARFWQKAEWIPQVDQVDNYLVNFEAGIETTLTKTISLKTFVIDNYASRPAAGRLKNDVKLVSALTYNF